MKYMTFNSSCSYAGLANLLAWYGIDTEDRIIALGMRLPYLFAREDDTYLSGPMLQGAKWFNLYLRPLGFAMSERELGREEVCEYLAAHPYAMLGLRVSPESKHAVVCTGRQDGLLRFINNKHPESPEPETLSLTEAELVSRLDGTAVVGTLDRVPPGPVGFRPYLADSLLVLENLQREIAAFCSAEQSPSSQRKAMNALFRPLLLDGVTMLELLRETKIAAALKTLQGQFLRALRSDRPAVLAREMDLPLLNDAAASYRALIAAQMKRE